jgi:hypothetical protein
MILLLLIHLAEKTAAKNLQIAGVASPAAELAPPGFRRFLGATTPIRYFIFIRFF